MENLKTIQIKDKDYVKVNPDTGEVKDAYVTRKVSMDEFIMLFFKEKYAWLTIFDTCFLTLS